MAARMTWKLRAGRFRRDEDGGALIEGVLWIPFFLFLLIMVADAAFILMNHARITRIMQDGNRHLSVGALEECADLTTWLHNNIRPWAPSANATCQDAATMLTVNVTVPADELNITGPLSFLAFLNVRSQTNYYKETV